MEFCRGETMDKFTQANNPDLFTKVIIMQQCAIAVSHMHSLKKPVVHRDLKPENILVHTDADKPTIKICDFGAAKITEKQGTVWLKTFTGTPIYMGPELFPEAKNPFAPRGLGGSTTEIAVDVKYDGSRVDVYSLGLLFLNLLMYEAGTTFNRYLGTSAIVDVDFIIILFTSIAR